MQVWVTVSSLVFVMAASMAAPALDVSDTTDGAIEEVREAAGLDLDFIRNDLQDLQQSYIDFMGEMNLRSARKIAQAVNQTLDTDMPSDTEGYNLLCLEGIVDIVEEMTQDLNIAVAVCVNFSQSVTKVDTNVAQFQVIISSLNVFSGNLSNIINACSKKFPILFNRLTCVFDQLFELTNKFGPVFDKFKRFNLAKNGHLMLLGVETSLCYQQALQRISDINKTILRDVDSCKE